ncbi:hypothetical protein [Streptomyces solicathayae]|uniref:Uncharacterized protein n=1 Tax=Streptomyces solicathayae TaxID=3081768 RepID=A0ABZ0LP05_9ACTN|nr:hypothetical protein [Streptomyces sp. HUAS YS2]WOX21236.1 hypothetical protein R2D22_07495 [Streptomyces sp. HUAS YS2]
MTDRTTYTTVTGLRRRGWTDAMVRSLLGAPDVQGRSPRLWSLAPVLLYLVARVEAVERTEEFALCSRAPGGSRSAAGIAGARARRRAVLAAIGAEPIAVPRLAGPDLERRAVRHRRLLGARGPGEVTAAMLVRWQVNYLRHALVRYEVLLDGLFGDVGRPEAERLLDRRLYEAIAVAYPVLAEECRRRIAAGEERGGVGMTG